jgi:DNA modification methylase
MATGEMSKAQFADFLTAGLKPIRAHTIPGAVVFSCIDWRSVEEMLAAGKAAAFDLLNICVWVKSNGGMGSFYRSRHELVLVFRNGDTSHQNNVQLGRHGRNRSNVWNYPGVNTFGRKGSENLLSMHPTCKPIAMVADAIMDCTDRGDIVLDSFLGSGTTILAAEKTGRRGYGMELDPLYVDTAVERWQRLTGRQAVNLRSETYDQRKTMTAATHG